MSALLRRADRDGLPNSGTGANDSNRLSVESKHREELYRQTLRLVACKQATRSGRAADGKRQTRDANRHPATDRRILTNVFAFLAPEYTITLVIMALIFCAWYFEWPGWRPRGPFSH